MSDLYIGLMSGTSIDGIDAALVDLGTPFKLISTHSEPIDNAIRQRIVELCTPGSNEIDKLGQLDIDLGKKFANAALNLIRNSGIDASDVAAIGSHGQTIRHRPPESKSNQNGFTLQIADPNTIAELTRITTVADFRRRDMAAGGQGAPFAPAFHQTIAPEDIETSAFLNLGGIANITLIHKGELICGFDTGPANGLMDAWIQKNKGEKYDKDGAWAHSGSVNSDLLKELKACPYFAEAAPKSTGREEFNLQWLEGNLHALPDHCPAADVQATLLQLSCETIVEAIDDLPETPEVIYCCGGGTYNSAFIKNLQHLCGNKRIADTLELGIAPDWIEACTFAWLAKLTLSNTPTALNKITGAKNRSIYGGIYYS